MRKILSVILTAALVICMSSVSMISFSADTTRTARYIVLALDVSGSTGKKISNGKTVIDSEKDFAKEFVRNNLGLDDDTNHEDRIAIVSFSDKAEKVIDFTDNIDDLCDAINGQNSRYNATTNFYDMFLEANTIFDEAAQGAKSFGRILYICSDGLPEDGEELEEYEYKDSDYKYYKEANAALKFDNDNVKSVPTSVYTFWAYPKNIESEELEFAKRFMKDLSNPPGYSQIVGQDEIPLVDPPKVIVNPEPNPPKPDTDKPQPTPSKPDTVNPTPTTQVYTAVDLIDKTIPEIIILMGGTYKFGNCSASDRTTIDHSDQVHYIENQEKIPGMRFCFKVMLTNGFDNETRESLESGKYPLYCIQVTGSAKADSKTNGSMNYNDCSKILGNINGQSGYLKSFNGKEPAVYYTYKTPDRNGIADVTLNFELNSALKAKNNLKSFTAEELKAANPKLTNIEVFAKENTNTNTNTNNDNNADTPKSPKTGVQNNYAVLFAAAIVSGAAIALTQKKRREDIR